MIQMLPVSIKPRPFPVRLIVAAAILLTISVHADQNFGSAPFPEKDPGFFHRASDSVGGFFRRLFKTDEPRQSQQPAPSPSKARSRGPRYNLDQPPPELRGTTPVHSNGVNTSPPAMIAPKDAGEPPTKSKSPANSANRNSTPVDEPPKTKSKTKKSATSDSSSPVASTDPASHPKTRKPVETTTGPTDSGNVLYSNTGPAKSKQPEPPAKVQTESAPAPPPPKAPSESASVLTGTKTGKSGRVKSPYAPYSELDVTGLPSGSLALDPTTQKVFRIP